MATQTKEQVEHTKGPWRVTGTAQDFVVRNKGAIYVAGIGRAQGDGQPEANARLIAAAPELLEACRNAQMRLVKIVKEYDVTPDAYPGAYDSIRELEACLALAEGKS